jgi:hypothetical protein
VAEDSLTRGVAFAGVAALGVCAEVASGASFGWATLDLAVGLGAAAGGVGIRGLPAADRALALAFAVLWFFGTLEAGVFVLAYRAPLVQLLYRLGTTRTTVVVLAVWLVALLPFGAASPLSTALAAVVLVSLVRAAPRAMEGARQALRAAAVATAFLVLVWGIAAADLADGVVLLAIGDLAVLGAMTVALSAAAGSWAREAGRALAIELGPTRRPGLPVTSRLARALADPELEVRYRVPGVGWVNERGREVPEPDGARRITRVPTPAGGEVVLRHGPGAPEDAALSRAAAAAAALSLEAARLDAEVRLRADEVIKSRRRLLEAADAERRALEQRLSERVLTRLRRVDRLLARRVYEPQRLELWAATSELRALARGLYPPVVARDDLRGALADLASRFELPVQVEIEGNPGVLAESHRAAVWFTCSEALTNVARHARATSVDIHLRVDDERLELEIADDGVGGAILERGLRGLSDRVEALGGTFALSSPQGGPTIVRVLLRV